MQYVVHPGNGKTTTSGSIEPIDAGTLASLYGLQPGDYILRSDFAPDAIHLTPRNDGKYKNIKAALGDNGLDSHLDYPAFMHKTRDGKYKSKRTIQPQYNELFRDGRANKNIL